MASQLNGDIHQINGPQDRAPATVAIAKPHNRWSANSGCFGLPTLSIRMISNLSVSKGNACMQIIHCFVMFEYGHL
ncbi:hypothetical protein BGW42_007885 [Actinomortierella wolfii]|nr:hypothetical protein BGW42_007885 [Actinomortierella wolfii]